MSHPNNRLTHASLKTGLDAIAETDAHVAEALELHGYPALRKRKPGFPALLRAIVGQQVSVAAAASIWSRIEIAVAPLTPENFLALDEEGLRALGLSRQKMAYGRDLASRVASGEVRLDRMGRLGDEAAIAELIQVKGIGRWTAEVYMLFAHGRGDVWPIDDLALVVALQRLKGLRKRPDRKRMLKLGKPWQPWRGAGAHLLWHYYHAIQQADAAAKMGPKASKDSAAPM